MGKLLALGMLGVVLAACAPGAPLVTQVYITATPQPTATSTPYIALTSTPVTPTEPGCRPGYIQSGAACVQFTPTPTLTPNAADATATQAANTKAMASYKSSCTSVTLGGLAASADKYEGKCVHLTERVKDLDGISFFFGSMANGEITYALKVLTSDASDVPDVSVGNEVAVWGTFEGGPAPIVTSRFVEFTPAQLRAAAATQRTADADATKQANPLTSNKGDGAYTVGQDIAPGRWKGDPNDLSGDCYWEVDRQNGDIYDNHFGTCFSIIYVPDWTYVVEIRGGYYTYLGK